MHFIAPLRKTPSIGNFGLLFGIVIMLFCHDYNKLDRCNASYWLVKLFWAFPSLLMNWPLLQLRSPPTVAPTRPTSPSALKPFRRKMDPSTFNLSAQRASPFLSMNSAFSQSRSPPTVAPSRQTLPSALKPLLRKTSPSTFNPSTESGPVCVPCISNAAICAPRKLTLAVNLHSLVLQRHLGFQNAATYS